MSNIDRWLKSKCSSCCSCCININICWWLWSFTKRHHYTWRITINHSSNFYPNRQCIIFSLEEYIYLCNKHTFSLVTHNRLCQRIIPYTRSCLIPSILGYSNRSSFCIRFIGKYCITNIHYFFTFNLNKSLCSIWTFYGCLYDTRYHTICRWISQTECSCTHSKSFWLCIRNSKSTI